MILYYRMKARNRTEKSNFYSAIRICDGESGRSAAKKILDGSPYEDIVVGKVSTIVTVKRVALNTAVKIMQESLGSGSYAWMVDSIERNGAIVRVSDRDRREMEAKRERRLGWRSRQ